MKESVYRATAAVEERHWWFQARGAVLKAVLQRVALPPRTQILDVGCGTGQDFRILQTFGEVTGVDAHPDAVRFCREQGFVRVFQQDALRLQFQDEAFDLVCILDVLNGIADDAAALREARRVLKPGGFLLCTAGAYPFLWGRTDDDSEHVRRYAPRAFRRLFREQNLHIVHQSAMNTVLFPLVVIERMLERISHPKKTGIPGLQLPPAPLNALLYALFSLERFMVPRVCLPWGVTQLVLARRPEEPMAAPSEGGLPWRT